MRRRARRLLLVLWALPNSLLGLALVAIALPRGRVRVVEGVLEAAGPGFARLARCVPIVPGGVCAVTLGHVVVGRDEASLDGSRRHERVHVRQYERWGPLFLPAYFAASLAARLAGGDAYLDNRFERAARADESVR